MSNNKKPVFIPPREPVPEDYRGASGLLPVLVLFACMFTFIGVLLGLVIAP